MRTPNLLKCTVIAVLLALSIPAQAIIIPLSAKVGNSPSGLGTGLDGEFWDAISSIPNLNAALGVIANAPAPTATFHASLIDYPRGTTNISNGPLDTFLGPDAVTMIGTNTTSLAESVFLFTGFINILAGDDTTTSTPNIDVNFWVASDDGFRLKIGGQIVAQAGNRIFPTNGFGTLGTASFLSSGLYPVELLYWNNGNPTGIEWTSSITGGLDVGAGTGRTAVPTSRLYVPEPASLALLGAGLVGLGFIRRRKT